MKLLLFNPATEYALASGASFYTPPKRVERLRMENQLLPEVWAESDDIILVDDTANLQSKFKLVDWGGLESLFQENPGIKIEPWGWNHALARKLRDAGVPEHLLPSKETLDCIREMAHRRNTIRLNELWNSKVDSLNKNGGGLPFTKTDVPVELSTEDECMAFWRENHGCWMKAPWSSSGRGVINTAADMTEELIRQWCHGIIKRQGSVMGETGADRAADYATEWRIEDRNAHYLGLSSFSTSNRGKYIANKSICQREMAEEFKGICKIDPDLVAELQKPILEEVFGRYEGLLGVDMIVERNGRLRPFVEVNLRRTMGMVFLN